MHTSPRLDCDMTFPAQPPAGCCTCISLVVVLHGTHLNQHGCRFALHSTLLSSRYHPSVQCSLLDASHSLGHIYNSMPVAICMLRCAKCLNTAQKAAQEKPREVGLAALLSWKRLPAGSYNLGPGIFDPVLILPCGMSIDHCRHKKRNPI